MDCILGLQSFLHCLLFVSNLKCDSDLAHAIASTMMQSRFRTRENAITSMKTFKVE